jgi:hypothetical protein
VTANIAPIQPPRKKANTTNFTFMPQSGDLDAPLPDFIMLEENASKDDHHNVFEQTAESGTLLLNDPDKSTWHCSHILGEGSNGRASLWLKLDETNQIIDVRC